MWLDIFTDGSVFLMKTNKEGKDVALQKWETSNEVSKLEALLDPTIAGTFQFANKPKPTLVVGLPQWSKIQHSYRNSGGKPEIYIWEDIVRIVADCDCDADGSPRIAQINPSSGQGQTSLGRTQGKYNGWLGRGLGNNNWEWVNAETIPYYVLPLAFAAKTGIKIRAGDLARVTWNNTSVYAIFADEGPEDIIGEGSIKLIEALGGDPWDMAHKQIVSGLPHGVEYVIKRNSVDFNLCFDFASIQEYGKKVFKSYMDISPHN
jgi:hypothetical protein